MPLPTDVTQARSILDHVADHNALHGLFNSITASFRFVEASGDITTALQAALDDVDDADGGTVFLLPGSASFSTVTIGDNTTLDCNRWATTLIQTGAGIKNKDQTNGNSGITIRNLDIDYTAVATAQRCISILTADSAVGTVDDILIEGVTARGGNPATASSTTVDAIQIGSTAAGATLNERNRIIGCYVVGSYGAGMRLKACKNSLTENCVAKDCKYGFFIQTASERSRVINCGTEHTYNIGIAIEANCEYITVEGNDVYTTVTSHGINTEQDCVFVSILNNTVTEAAEIGIRSSGPGTSEYVTISGNTVTDCQYGIFADAAPYPRVTNNTCSGCDREGIVIRDAVGGSVTNNDAIDNSTSGAYPGIRLTACTDVRVNGNGSSGAAQTYGIEETGASDYNLLLGNQLRGNLTAAATVVGANTVEADNVS